MKKRWNILLALILLSGCAAAETPGLPDTEETVTDTQAPNIQFSDRTYLVAGQFSMSELFNVNDDHALTLESAGRYIDDQQFEACVSAKDSFDNEASACKEFKVMNSERFADYDFQNNSLAELLNQYMAERGLSEENLAYFYQNTVTEETFVYNGETLMMGGNTIKVALAMCYTRLIQQGVLDYTDTLPYTAYDYEAGGGYTAINYAVGSQIPLGYLLNQSIQESDNTATNILLRNYYKFDEVDFRERFAEFYPQEYPSDFYVINLISAQLMKHVMSALYADQDLYSLIIEDMKKAMPQRYFKKRIYEFEVAHKYGLYGISEHDMGIIYTPEPILVGVFTQNVYDAETVIAELAELSELYAIVHEENQ